MSEDQADSSHPRPKNWVDKISQFLTGEPQDREDLLEILKEAEEKQLLDNDALSMIEGVLQVSEIRARDIMIPRIQMVVVPKDAELATIFPLVIESAHSRFPVIDEDRSEVVGIMLAKDLLIHSRKDESLTVEQIMRSASFIPESKRLNVLLNEFKANRNHMAIIVDEYGTAAGLVTIEDVLEQIVGEIEDEHDPEGEDYIFRRSDTEYTVKALTPLAEFNDYFSANLDDSEFGTISGLVVHKLEHLPKKGEKVTIDRFRFEVLKADNRRVHLLKLKLLKLETVDEDVANGE